MAKWFDEWLSKKDEEGELESVTSDSGAVVDPDETIEEVVYDSDFDSDATIPDYEFLKGYLSDDEEEARASGVGVLGDDYEQLDIHGRLDRMLMRGGLSLRRPCGLS
ncbi:hypothetical protein TWF281_002193 [Arthrobotrys megalospora]